MDKLVGDQGGTSNMFRDYRKGNWTVKETMILIEAKKMDDERRMRRQEGKPTELRWKWVEDYCWRNGCLRSQNQCNDKWDNLMRDFKKVREYERGVVEAGGEEIARSYWRIEKNERKEKNLPTNMLLEIYEALVEVVDRKSQRMLLPSLPPTLQQQSTQPQITPLSFSPPPLLPLPATVAQTDYTTRVPFTTMCDSSDPDHSSERSDSPAKKRRMSGGGEGTSGTSKGNINNSSQEVGIAISKSTAIIAETIESCKEREDKRHRELLSLHQRRLQIEESKAEINREGINGLVDSINKLANSILALAGNKNQSNEPK